jgi:hypothetical protein
VPRLLREQREHHVPQLAMVEEPAAAAPAKSAAEAAVAMPVPRSVPSAAVTFAFTFVPAHQAELRVAAEVMFEIKITSHGIVLC